MPHTPVTICNLGLLIIGASQISSISPARTPTEKTCATGYPQWRDSELSRRRWTFATEKRALTLSTTLTSPDTNFLYAYELPSDTLRVIREPLSRWVLRGRVLWSQSKTETVELLVQRPEGEFSALFVDVLAARIGRELAEPKTQSNEKWQKASSVYNDAVREAARLNAFQLEPDDVQLADENDGWLAERFYGPR